MTTLLDEPPSIQTTNPADRLRTEMIAMRLSFTWFGTRKSLSAEQKAVAAESLTSRKPVTDTERSVGT